ncbi:MAG TPA: IS1595 family transposase [Rhizomicrobium sp.]|nr:IS1595 family transposase [Rhizomicrobium sp.]
MTEEQAYAAFQAIRFASTGGEPVCPSCDCPAYTFKCRKIFKCKNCGKRFSLTSGTPFASHKLTFGDILYAMAIYSMGAKGTNAIELSHRVNISYKSAFVLLHRLREAVAQDADLSPLVGEVEFDCAEVGGYIRPKNVKKLRKDLRKYPYRSPDKLIVVVARERKGRARTTIVENISDAKKFIRKVVSRTATVYCDCGTEWSDLQAIWDLKRVDHNYSWWTPNAHTNNAESYFAMLRKAQKGVYHRFSSPRYLHAYTEEMAWRQNVRRQTNSEKYSLVLQAAAVSPISSMKGYWQRHVPKSAR